MPGAAAPGTFDESIGAGSGGSSRGGRRGSLVGGLTGLVAATVMVAATFIVKGGDARGRVDGHFNDTGCGGDFNSVAEASISVVDVGRLHRSRPAPR